MDEIKLIDMDPIGSVTGETLLYGVNDSVDDGKLTVNDIYPFRDFVSPEGVVSILIANSEESFQVESVDTLSSHLGLGPLATLTLVPDSILATDDEGAPVALGVGDGLDIEGGNLRTTIPTTPDSILATDDEGAPVALGIGEGLLIVDGDLTAEGGGGGLADGSYGDIDVSGGDLWFSTDRNKQILAAVYPNIVSPPPSNRWFDQSPNSNNTGVQAGVANRMDLYRMLLSEDTEVDAVGVAVSTFVAGSNVKILVYASDADGWPSTKIFESDSISTGTPNGLKSISWSYTFLKYTMYWVGVRHSSTATLRVLNVAEPIAIGLMTSDGTTYGNGLRRTLAFATPAPDPWDFSVSNIANVSQVSIRFRRIA